MCGACLLRGSQRGISSNGVTVIIFRVEGITRMLYHNAHVITIRSNSCGTRGKHGEISVIGGMGLVLRVVSTIVGPERRPYENHGEVCNSERIVNANEPIRDHSIRAAPEDATFITIEAITLINSFIFRYGRMGLDNQDNGCGTAYPLTTEGISQEKPSEVSG